MHDIPEVFAKRLQPDSTHLDGPSSKERRSPLHDEYAAAHSDTPDLEEITVILSHSSQKHPRWA